MYLNVYVICGFWREGVARPCLHGSTRERAVKIGIILFNTLKSMEKYAKGVRPYRYVICNVSQQLLFFFNIFALRSHSAVYDDGQVLWGGWSEPGMALWVEQPATAVLSRETQVPRKRKYPGKVSAQTKLYIPPLRSMKKSGPTICLLYTSRCV